MDNHYSPNMYIRDLLLFVVLILLSIAAFKRSHRPSISAATKPAAPTASHQPFMVHEVDQEFLQNINRAQEQIEVLFNKNLHTPLTFEQHATLNSINNHLTDIHDQYTKTSPGIALLGPIGTTSVVLKERKLAILFLNQLHELAQAVFTIASQQPSISATPPTSDTIDETLAYIDRLIKLL